MVGPEVKLLGERLHALDAQLMAIAPAIRNTPLTRAITPPDFACRHALESS
jgi:hypothetical protein